MLETIVQPWPWYVAGPLIGLTVPLLLIAGNKPFGISSSLRHICAACTPIKVSFFAYDWKKEAWNLFFVFGIAVGGFLTLLLLAGSNKLQISEATVLTLKAQGLTHFTGLMPSEIFTFKNAFNKIGFVFFALGGFLVGFGTRYAGGCTSGHSIMGIANLQWPSLLATASFMAGGILMAQFLLPIILPTLLK